MERRAATESEMRSGQRLAMDAAEMATAQGKHRATVANAAGDAVRQVAGSAGEVAPGVPVIIPATLDAVANAASKAAGDAVRAGATPGMVADAVRGATDVAIEYCIRGV